MLYYPAVIASLLKVDFPFIFFLLWINYWYWVIPMFGQNKQTNNKNFPWKKPLPLNNNLYEGKIKHLKNVKDSTLHSQCHSFCGPGARFLISWNLLFSIQSWRLKNYDMEWRTLSSNHIAGMSKRAAMSLWPLENLKDWNPFCPSWEDKPRCVAEDFLFLNFLPIPECPVNILLYSSL